jgi:antirestriction protein ArdC
MNANELFERITAQLIADIEAGAGTWTMPWHRLPAATPTSIDRRPYRGLNALWLPMVAADNGWTSGIWATYRGWQCHGGQVRRGSHGTQVVLWKTLDTRRDPDDTTAGDNQTRRRLVARTYTVFAAEQVDGMADLVATRLEDRPVRNSPQRVCEAEAYFDAVGATVTEHGDRACYRPAADEIRVPALDQFDSSAHFYATLAHEHIHWTGHPSRLARDLTGRFGSDAYAAEELVAELGAAFWCNQHALSTVTRPDHAAYLAGWLRVLRADPRALVTVTSKAQAALDHLNTTAGHTAAA